jgi:hypothetical protein
LSIVFNFLLLFNLFLAITIKNKKWKDDKYAK